jgi:hypothetical protein
MKRKSQFECDSDVEQHFAAMAELSGQPVPPADLWERMEKDRRAAQSKRAIPRVASAPEVFRYEPTNVLRRRPVYPVSEIREVSIAPAKKCKRVTTQRLSPVPKSLVSLVHRASNRKKKQK